MLSTLKLSEFQGRHLNSSSRQDLLDALRFRREHLPPDLQKGLETQPMDRLILLVLVAWLLGALRH